MEVNEAAIKAKDFRVQFENLCGDCFVVSNPTEFYWSPIPYTPRLMFYNVESAKSEIDSLAETEKELMTIETTLNEAEAVHSFNPAYTFTHCFSILGHNYLRVFGVMQKKKHFEQVMNTRVLSDLKNAEAKYRELEQNCKVHLYSCMGKT